MSSEDAVLPDADYVVAMLEEAGASIIAMRVVGLRPAGYGSGWPEFVREAIEAYGWTEEAPRPRTPSAAAITRMDKAYRWLTLIPNDRYVLRRIVGARSLVHPLTEKHVFSWRRLGMTLGADHKAVQRWHGDGIALIVAGLRREAAATSSRCA